MTPVIHLIAAWLIAMAFAIELKERRIVVLAGIIPDIDAVFILFDFDAYIKYHHTFGHSYVFGIPFVFITPFLFLDNLKSKLKVSLIALLGFTSHLVLDIIGSDWPVSLFYPMFSEGYCITPWVSNEIIYWVINPVFAIIIVSLMALVIFKKESSPIEFISQKFDKITTGFFIYPFRFRCNICGKRASYFCEVCMHHFCPNHVNKFFATRCRNCEKKQR
jgi:hypothetical protein